MSLSKQIIDLLRDGEKRNQEQIASALLVPSFLLHSTLRELTINGQIKSAGQSSGVYHWRREAGGRQPVLDATVDRIESTRRDGHQPDDESRITPPQNNDELFSEFPPEQLSNAPHWILDSLGWQYREPADPSQKGNPPGDSPIRWMGGKSKMVHQLMDWYPEHHTYVEVFGGSLKPFFCKQASQIEIVNDVYTSLINFWRVASRWPSDLANAVNAIPASRVAHRLFQREDGTRTPWERAVMFGYLVRTSFNGKPWSSFGGSAASGPGRVDGDLLERCAERLASQGVFIECQSFRDLIPRYNKKLANGIVFFYLDPPYYNTAGYADSFPDAWHRDIAQYMEEIHDNGNLVLMTNSPDAKEAYQKWLRTDGTWCFNEYIVKYSASGSDTGRGDVVETIISNFPLKTSDQKLQGSLLL